MPDIKRELNLSDMECKVAVLCHTYHNTQTKTAFVSLLTLTTSISPDQLELAWELLDYVEDMQSNCVPPGKANAH